MPRELDSLVQLQLALKEADTARRQLADLPDSMREVHQQHSLAVETMRRLEAYSGHADGPELVAWIRERLPVSQGIFLTHGEEETRAAFKQALVTAGCDGSKIFLPQLDDRVDLMQGIVQAPKQRRLPPEAVGRLDWHNGYAALILDLRQRLDALPDDKAREALLGRVRATLGQTAQPG